jgi:hypothetical protein
VLTTVTDKGCKERLMSLKGLVILVIFIICFFAYENKNASAKNADINTI